MDNQVTELRRRLITALEAVKSRRLKQESTPIRLLVELHISTAQEIPHSNEKSQKDRKWLRRSKNILEVFSKLGVLFAALTFIFNIRPQWIWGNNDFLAMANAGDVSSQIYLADLYYRTGRYEDSIYWYSIASIHSGEIQGVAYNNLAYLYAKSLGVNGTDENAFIYERAYKLFKEAALFFDEKGDIDHKTNAERNALQCLVSHSTEDFSDINYYDEIWQYVNNPTKYVWLDEIYYLTPIYKGPVFTESDIKYRYCGIFAISMPNSCSTSSYVYWDKDYVEGTDDRYKLVYIDISVIE